MRFLSIVDGFCMKRLWNGWRRMRTPTTILTALRLVRSISTIGRTVAVGGLGHALSVGALELPGMTLSLRLAAELIGSVGAVVAAVALAAIRHAAAVVARELTGPARRYRLGHTNRNESDGRTCLLEYCLLEYWNTGLLDSSMEYMYKLCDQICYCQLSRTLNRTQNAGYVQERPPGTMMVEVYVQYRSTQNARSNRNRITEWILKNEPKTTYSGINHAQTK